MNLLATRTRLLTGAALGLGLTILSAQPAYAGCNLTMTSNPNDTVDCGTTTTTDTVLGANMPNDREYPYLTANPVYVVVQPGAVVDGFGLAFTDAGVSTNPLTVTNNGSITVGAGNTPTAGGTGALSISAVNTPIIYNGSGSISNLGTGVGLGVTITGSGSLNATIGGSVGAATGNAINVQNNGTGTITIDAAGPVTATAGEGIVVRDTTAAGSTSVTTGAVTALNASTDGIDVQTNSLTGNLTEVANGNIQAGNAGMVAAILQGAATGNIDVTLNGSIDARFGIDAENFGSGLTLVQTVGSINVTNGNGIFARTNGGDVSIIAGDVTSVSNTAIVARQTDVAGGGVMTVRANDVSGTIGIEATNSGTGPTFVTAFGDVTGTAAEGILATGNGAVAVLVNDTVAGATRGLSLVGGTGGSGDITVAGTGGFTGGSGDAANILNNGSGFTLVNLSGAVTSTAGEGIVVRNTAVGGEIFVIADDVTALTANRDGIDVQAQSLTGDVTIIGNGNIAAGNAGVVAAILPSAGTGDVRVTVNGTINARFGVDAENLGTGSTVVITAGQVTATSGNGIFARSTGGDVAVSAGAVTSTGNTAIIARQVNAAGAGSVSASGSTVSGTVGIEATNSGTGTVAVTASGPVTGTAAEGILATGNSGVVVLAGGVVTGATRGLSLTGGTAGTGDVLVAGSGGFVGGTGDGVNILNNGNGFTLVNVSGAISSTAGEGLVVRNTSVGGEIIIIADDVTALAANKDGIDAQSQSLTGNLTEVANGNIQAGNAGMVAAILQGAATGNINVTANGSITARFGIDAENFGSGSTSVTTVGPVNVTNGDGIFAQTSGGNVTVAAGDVTSTGNTAIIARQTDAAQSGTLSVSAGNVSGTTGIEATNSGTGTVAVTATGTLTGTTAEGILATGNNAVTIQASNTVTGATRGLSLIGGTGGAGNISVTGTGGFVGGTGDAANIKNNGSGTVTVDIEGASSSAGGNGFIIRDTAAGGDINVTTGAVTAITANKNGIDVQTQSTTADITEVANGNIQAGNAGMVAAIFPAAGTGNIDVTANGSITARFGIDAENFGSGNTFVTTVGPVNVTNGNGIFALATGGNVIVNAGDVTSTGNTAIIAQQVMAAGTGVLSVTAGNVSGTTGIDAHNFGSGALAVSATDTVTGTAAQGIIATGNAAVTVGVADTVTGATRGLSLIGGTGGSGNILVTGTGGFVGGTGDAANILNNGSGNVLVNISGASSSTGGEGIVVRDTAAAGSTSVTTGAVTVLDASSDGIDVQTNSLTGNLTEVANGNIQAGNAGMVAAIFPAAATGNIDITANGSITARFGIDAENFGSGSTSVTTVGPVNVTNGNGIYALSIGGNVAVNAGNVTSTSNTAIVAQQTNAAAAGSINVATNNVSGTVGITVINAGSGATTVTTGGTTAGTAGNGITTTSASGATTISVGGNVTGTIDGISATSSAGGALTVNLTGGNVSGVDDGISLSSSSGAKIVNIGAGRSVMGANGVHLAGGSTGVVNNLGTLGTAGTVAVLTDATTAVTVNNGSGATMNGRVELSGGVDRINNAGTWNVTGANNFYGGADALNNIAGGVLNLANGTSFTNLETLTNAGTVNVTGTTTFSGVATAFANSGTIRAENGVSALNGLSALANTGIIDLQDGAVGDVLTIGGNYSGAGAAALYIDYSGAAADRLVITGAASGSTALYVAPTANFGINSGGVLVVDTGTTTANAFTLAGPTSFGLIDLSLAQIGQDYYLQLLPNVAVFEPAAVGNMAQDMWYQSADVYAGYAALRRSDLGSARKDGVGTWVQLYASRDKQGDTRSIGAFGGSYDIDLRLETDRRGAQGGVDYKAGNFVVGLTAGYQHANADLRNSAGGFDAEGHNFGAYAMFGTGKGIYGGVLVKQDKGDLRFKNSLFAAANAPEIKSTGAEAELGYRFDSGTMNVDLGAGLSTVRTHIDDFSVGLIDFDFDRSRSMRGRLGARLGFGGSWAPYVDAKLLHEFKGDTRLTLGSGADLDGINAPGRGTWGRIEAGVGGNKGPGPILSGWVDLGDVKGLGVRAGFRF